MTPLRESLGSLQSPVKEDFQNRCCILNEASVQHNSSSSSGEGDSTVIEEEATFPLVRKRLNPSVSADSGLGDPAPAKKPRTPSNHSNSAKDTGRDTLFERQAHQLNNDLPDDFLEALDDSHVETNPASILSLASTDQKVSNNNTCTGPQQMQTGKIARQFWKAGDYESTDKLARKATSGMDHVRVHPKFLHSNATSHKWALGAMAELLDNAVDETVHGATFAKIDTPRNPKKEDPMLLIEDDGGGMCPETLRHCMSLGYSLKSKSTNTIGQYGNGFKTSTMRLGADVIVFTRSQGKPGSYPTQSIGMLSYTFLRETGQEDIIVPMVDYEILPFGLRKLIRGDIENWNKNMESVTRWSPYSSESELLSQFADMKTQGTKVIVFNLWEDDEGQLELDLDANPYDIQVRAKRNEKQISMAEKYPTSWHYLTYEHSLRSYASILYLKLPPGFKMFLRGKEIEHHSLINDLMHTQTSTYRPQVVANMHKELTSEAKAVVTIGFVKDAKEHIDVQGFSVYHKNRLIKPFWRLWNSVSCRGRGVIGVLEANFVEPAHDKQGFEKTIVLSRLEARLIEMQKAYWTKNCHKVGYVNHSLKGKNDQGGCVLGDRMDCNTDRQATCSSVPNHRTQRSASPNLNNLSSSKPPQTTTSIVKDIPLSTPSQVPTPVGPQSKHMSSNLDTCISMDLPAVKKTSGQLHARTQLTGTRESSHQSSLSNSTSPFCQTFSPSRGMQNQDQSPSFALTRCSLQPQSASIHQSTVRQTKKVPAALGREIHGTCPLSPDLRTLNHHSHSAAEGSGDVVQKFCTQEKEVAQGKSQKHVARNDLLGAEVRSIQECPSGHFVDMNTSSAKSGGHDAPSEIDKLVQRCSAPNGRDPLNADSVRSKTTATAGSVGVSMRRQSTSQGLSAAPDTKQQKCQIMGMPSKIVAVACERVLDQSHKASTNNEALIYDSRRSLEDLGRMIVKRAVLSISNKPIAMPKGSEDNCAKANQNLIAESRGRDEEIIGDAKSSTSSHKAFVAQIVDMGLEIQSLQRKLEKAIEERDELKQQLIEERIQGHRKMEALQNTLVATLRELEARNNSLRFVRSTSFRISDCLKNVIN